MQSTITNRTQKQTLRSLLFFLKFSIASLYFFFGTGICASTIAANISRQPRAKQHSTARAYSRESFISNRLLLQQYSTFPLILQYLRLFTF